MLTSQITHIRFHNRWKLTKSSLWSGIVKVKYIKIYHFGKWTYLNKLLPIEVFCDSNRFSDCFGLPRTGGGLNTERLNFE